MSEFMAQDYISEEDFNKFEEKYNTEQCSGRVEPETQFQYGWCLVRSQYKDDIKKGILLLEGLCSMNVDSRDFIFFVAIGYYKLGEYNTALAYVNRLLSIEPNNHQGKDLKRAIDQKLKNDGALGVALVAGAIGVGALLLGAVLGAKKR